MFKKLLIRKFLFIFVFIPAVAFAQSDSIRTTRFTVLLSPQHLLINSLRLEVQKIPQHDSRHSFIFSPRLFSGKTRTVDFFTSRRKEVEDQARVWGYGAEAQHRIYLTKVNDLNKEWVYVAYGLNYHYFTINFEKEALVPVVESDGQTYYIYQLKPFTEKINRWGTVALFGAQNALFSNNRIIWDVHVGLGYNYSHITSNYSFIRYNVNLMDFGNTNVYFLANLKFGLFF